MSETSESGRGGRPRWDSVKSHVNRLRLISRQARKAKSYQAAAACEIAVGRALGIQPASPIFAGKGLDSWNAKANRAAANPAQHAGAIAKLLDYEPSEQCRDRIAALNRITAPTETVVLA